MHIAHSLLGQVIENHSRTTFRNTLIDKVQKFILDEYKLWIDLKNNTV
jgi:hypothetical protein